MSQVFLAARIRVRSFTPTLLLSSTLPSPDRLFGLAAPGCANKPTGVRPPRCRRADPEPARQARGPHPPDVRPDRPVVRLPEPPAEPQHRPGLADEDDPARTPRPGGRRTDPRPVHRH